MNLPKILVKTKTFEKAAGDQKIELAKRKFF